MAIPRETRLLIVVLSLLVIIYVVFHHTTTKVMHHLEIRHQVWANSGFGGREKQIENNREIYQGNQIHRAPAIKNINQQLTFINSSAATQQQPPSTSLDEHVVTSEEDRQMKQIEWLDRADSVPYRGYDGDGSCVIDNAHHNRLVYASSLLLRNWTKIANKHKIRYMLDFGTLLGAWRDEQMIPYDADVDIRVHNDDLMTLYNLPIRVRTHVWNPKDDHDLHLYFTRDWTLPYKFRRWFSCEDKQVPGPEGECSFTNPIARLIYRDWHIDIFSYTTYHDTVKFLPKGKQSFRKDDILPLARCNYMGIECRCPKKPFVVLKDHYDEYLYPKICKNKKWINLYEGKTKLLKVILALIILMIFIKIVYNFIKRERY